MKVRPLGQVMLDLEELLLEMTESHELQYGDILNLVYGYLEVHCPHAKEEYLDGTNPTFFYGHKEQK